MSEADRVRWDGKYAGRSAGLPQLPDVFAPYVSEIPRSGEALDLACGFGAASVWLAEHGLTVWGVDVSATAIEQARDLAARHAVAGRCRFSVADLDDGLPQGPPAAMILCHRFRDPGVYPAIIDRLAADGVLAISVLSEVGSEPGPFRAGAGELADAFAGLQTLAAGEGDGQAWLVARRKLTQLDHSGRRAFVELDDVGA
ncbi:bifunctional 2-polyprenyl-6-hydroxyphenol methylase/3-demethylubiquinol 3-O-methyltransferase UbiG [Mycolicibacterium sp. P1-5]|uniref:class I SAM-dependent methyltransferase n=1 Tax=Mycolicibacterium sp. P1-5 TaxID=2024617 RepID=UPI001883D811|nr:class I SAM-dependent methyltransferase [Mycolicibacterium sp. P1-5]